MNTGLCAAHPDIGFPIGRIRAAMDALMVQRLSKVRAKPLQTSLRVALYGYEGALHVEDGRLILRPMAMDVLMIIAIEWKKFWRVWIQIGDAGDTPIDRFADGIREELAAHLARQEQLALEESATGEEL